MRNIYILLISFVQLSAVVEIIATPCSDGTKTPDDMEKLTTRRVKSLSASKNIWSLHELQTINELWRYILNYSDIRFPEEEMSQTSFVPSPGASEPKCAKGSTFCEAIDNYPTARVDLLLKEHAHKYEELFGADMIEGGSNIANRYNGIEEEESLCKSQERIIHPQAGLTQDNTWMYIVNQKNYTQGVRVEECIHTKQCEMTQNFPLGYKAECKQKYIYRQLLAINESGHTVKDLFRLPSCCQCVLIRTDRNKRSIN
ncbi:protein spaetzle-like isoform X2 [Bradysia coprophila]|uniref:protein spaetzle-like isoform X2 n=1 Tax=Bradysia coprophila TaxID=38358 RepID=UPI00187DBFD2|nr:protein spaetzle-like isoform X2 [Bradysia coprophila]